MILFILAHLLLSSLIYFLGFNKINKQERFCNFILSISFPVGGYITGLILYLSRNMDSKEIDDEADIEDAHILFTDRFNSEKEINIIPLEETLLINDTKMKRQQLIDALKKDASKYIDMLKIALRDEDVETSHYAASAIAEIKKNLDLKLQKFSVEYEKNKFDIKLLKEYVDVLEEYLGSSLLDEFNRKKTIVTYIRVLENLIKVQEVKAVYYKKLINALLDTREMERAERYCITFLKEYENEDAYLVNLKYYYLIRDKKSFDTVFKKLLKSPIRLSNRGLNIIRFWLEGV
ncbi:hypothetical protein [Wukongibacter sp. M2B1]|uniref:hypothetical protein n=1 Tax=Wukongibacter sp. M2B1 TaxID=3088895 RepID=UPI003D7A2A9D